MKSLEQKKKEALQVLLVSIQLFTHTVKPLVFFKTSLTFKELDDVKVGCNECFGRAWYILSVGSKHLYYIQDKNTKEIFILVYYMVGDNIKNIIMVQLENLSDGFKSDKELLPLLDELMVNRPEIKKYITKLREI